MHLIKIINYQLLIKLGNITRKLTHYISKIPEAMQKYHLYMGKAFTYADRLNCLLPGCNYYNTLKHETSAISYHRLKLKNSISFPYQSAGYQL
jgi:hypothetical protein